MIVIGWKNELKKWTLWTMIYTRLHLMTLALLTIMVKTYDLSRSV
jgi:hypothetical protein